MQAKRIFRLVDRESRTTYDPMKFLIPADPFAKDEEKLSFADNFAKSLEELWTTKDYSDFVIIGGGEEPKKEFKVHKFVLGAQSPVFTATFRNEMKEKQEGKMFIEDFSAEAVEKMLKFMYTGEIKDERNAMDLFGIADKYNVTGLKDIAEMIILRNLNESNALEVFNLSHLHNSAVMKQKSFEIIKKMISDTILDDRLIEKPEAVQGIILARKDRKRKHDMVELEFHNNVQKFNNM